jgi:uncharacterized protein (TIGR03435 family)
MLLKSTIHVGLFTERKIIGNSDNNPKPVPFFCVGRSVKMRLFWLAPFFILPTTGAFAQNPSPQFEVATVKSPGPQDRIIALYNYPGGRLVITLYTFAQLLHEAIGVQRFQVLAAPAWIDSDRFMIEGKPPASSKLNSFRPSNREAPLVEEQRQMLLALLIDRFQLKFHRESKEGIVYLLTQGPKEPMFTPPKHPETRMFFAGLLGGGNGTVSGGNATMDFVVSQLSRSMGGPVIDRTGLTGPFDFTLEHVYDPAEEHDLVTIAQRTVGGLGLKLERQRGPVEMIVIDHWRNLQGTNWSRELRRQVSAEFRDEYEFRNCPSGFSNFRSALAPDGRPQCCRVDSLLG